MKIRKQFGPQPDVGGAIVLHGDTTVGQSSCSSWGLGNVHRHQGRVPPCVNVCLGTEVPEVSDGIRHLPVPRSALWPVDLPLGVHESAQPSASAEARHSGARLS